MGQHDDLQKQLKDMRQSMLKWLEYLAQHRVTSCYSGKTCWIPSADIHETEIAYHVFVDLAGIDPDSIELVVEGNNLSLNGTRQRPRVDGCTRIHQLEIDFGGFQRMFWFPVRLDADGAQSRYRQGLLEITLPKHRGASPVQVMLQHE